MRMFALVFLLGVLPFCVTNSIDPAPADRIVEPDVDEAIQETPLKRIRCDDPIAIPAWSRIPEVVRIDAAWVLKDNPELLNCTELIEVAYFNLDGKGPNEIIARAKRWPLCSPTGNCMFWVFQKRGARYVQILFESHSSYGPVNKPILATRLNGYHTIHLKDHSGMETNHSWFKFKAGKHIRYVGMTEYYSSRGTTWEKWL